MTTPYLAAGMLLLLLLIACSKGSAPADTPPSSSAKPEEAGRVLTTPQRLLLSIQAAKSMPLEDSVKDHYRKSYPELFMQRSQAKIHSSLLKPTSSIPSDNPKVIQIAKALESGAADDFDKIYRVHSFVALYLFTVLEMPRDVYETELAKCKASESSCAWLDAPASLQSGYGHCGTYANLAAAILRSMGIAARTVEMTAEARTLAREKTGQSLYHQWNEILIGDRKLHMDVIFDDTTVAGTVSLDWFLFEPEKISTQDFVHHRYEVQSDYAYARRNRAPN